MKVLFAIGQNTSNEVQENILEEFRNRYDKSFNYKSEYYVDGVLKCLDEEKFDVLILNEELENEPVNLEIIDKITDHHPNLKVIFAINDNHREDDYTDRLYAIGVYDSLYFSDFETDNLISLLNCQRNKRQAKEYYGIDEKIEDIDIKFQVTPLTEEEITKTISSLQQSIENGNLDDIFKQVSKEYNAKEMCYLLTVLPNNIGDILSSSNNKIYSKYQKKVHKQINTINTTSPEKEIKYVVKEVPVEKIQYVDRVKEVIKEVPVEIEKEKTVVVEKEIFKVSKVRFDSIITLVSDCSSGKSYITWNLAHALAQNYKVAVVNIDRCSSANAYFGTVDNKNLPLDNIENKSIKQVLEEGISINKNLTLFTGKFGEQAELNRNVLPQLISAIQSEEYSIIIIDTETGYSRNLISAINLANDILFVYSMDNSHIRMNDLLIKRLNEELHLNNTVAVLNNAYKNSKEYSNVIQYLEKSNQFKDVIAVNNCGENSYDYMYSKTCNYLKDNNEFTRDLEVLINTLRLQNNIPNNKLNNIKGKNSLLNKFFGRRK